MPANPYATAYKKTTTSESTNPREVEGRALVEAARRLMAAYDKPDDHALAMDAIDFNWQLWTIFQTEASTEASPLPLEMKVHILELCRFIDKAVVRFYANRHENLHLLKLFADMNHNIASGLFQQPENKD